MHGSKPERSTIRDRSKPPWLHSRKTEMKLIGITKHKKERAVVSIEGPCIWKLIPLVAHQACDGLWWISGIQENVNVFNKIATAI